MMRGAQSQVSFMDVRSAATESELGEEEEDSPKEEKTEKQTEIICTECPCVQGEICDADLDQHFTDLHVSQSLPSLTASESPAGISKYSQKLTPFFLKHVYGVNVDVPVCNLTQPNIEVVFCAGTHAGIVYDYECGVTNLLQGHQNVINTIAACKNGKLLVTGDSGPENLIVVWDRADCLPVLTIYNPYPKVGTAVVGISQSGKYLITISNGRNPTVDVRFWTTARNYPDYTFQTTAPGTPKAISFNPNKEENVMVAFEKLVLFFTIDPVEFSAKICIPDIWQKQKHRMGLITDCTFIENCHESVACTDNGCMLVFGNTIYSQMFSESPIIDPKLFIKLVRISEVRLNCMTTVDGLVVTGDSLGKIKFYDGRLKLLYWCQNFDLPSIKSISFDLKKKEYVFKDPLDYDTDDSTRDSDFDDKCKNCEIIYTNMVPSDATLQKRPFITRNFIVSTEDGNVYRIDFMSNTCTGLFFETDDRVAAVDAHSDKQFLCIAYASGRITLHNYATYEKMFECILPEPKDTDEEVYITCLKYSPQSLHLACGRSNGEVWMLDQMDIQPKNEVPLRGATYSIQRLCFSSNSMLMAYYDDERTVCLFSFRPWLNDWLFIGKTRFHYKTITDIVFSPYLPSRLFTIGEDRLLVEYDTINSMPVELLVVKSERIEQTAVPQAFVFYPHKDNKEDRYILVSNSELKYKKINDQTFKCATVTLGPAYKCFENSPVQRMLILPHSDEKYIIFSTEKHIGVQLLPPDGNPYKYNGIIAHPHKIRDFSLSKEGKWIFTIGENERCVMFWQVNPQSVEHLKKFGGEDLNPFYCLIEGGRNGWMFSEMQDLFYYMQILHQGENTMLPREVNEYIPISELADLMKACGYYLTEAETEILMTDIGYRDFHETGKVRETVTFFEFVLLFVNHRPARGITASTLQRSFDIVAESGDGYGAIDKDEFLNQMTTVGEPFTTETLQKCLMSLTRQEHLEDPVYEVQDPLWFLPTDISYDYFLDEIMGIDLKKLGAGKIGLSTIKIADPPGHDEQHDQAEHD